MSIRFCEIIMSDKTGFTSRFLLEGHPDEEDLRTNEDLLHEVDLFNYPIRVSAQQYCFMTASNEEDADCNHFALIHAYDEMVGLCNSLKPSHMLGTFTDRDDVEHGDYFEFQVEEDLSC